MTKKTLISLTGFLLFWIIYNNNVFAQQTVIMPVSIADDIGNDQITAEWVMNKYHQKLADPNTTNSERKKLQRWKNYVFRNYNILDDGSFTNHYYSQAVESIYNSPLYCDDNDLADWIDDGPRIPMTGSGNMARHRRGWIDAIYNNPQNLDEYVIGTRTSGIMRSTDNGLTWINVTDSYNFPVLGTKQIIASPFNDQYLLCITGTDKVKGGIIYSENAGADWIQITQELPQFHWLDFHPTIQGLVFAASGTHVYYSTDSGLSWQILGAPPNFEDIDHRYLHKILCLDDKLLVTTDYAFTTGCELFQADLSIAIPNVNALWSDDLVPQLFDFEGTVNFVNFSNLVGQRFYLLVNRGGCYAGPNLNNRVYKSIDGGDSYTEVWEDVYNPGTHYKGELIASLNDANMFYTGCINSRLMRHNEITQISGNSNAFPGNSGRYDDFRCSHIVNNNGKDRIALGNDGGPALIRDGIVFQDFKLESLTGDLSNNLIHAFDVHERTKDILFNFQDHAPRKRFSSDGSFGFSSMNEGSLAYIQPLYPNAMVAENAYEDIDDFSGSDHLIVENGFGENRCFLGGYWIPYLHHNDRFARGLGKDSFGGTVDNGGVAINKDANESEVSEIPESSEIGAIAICERQHMVMYAAENSPAASVDGVPDTDKLYKTEDDGETWEILTEGVNASLVSFDDGQSPQLLSDLLAWDFIRAIAVDHSNPDKVYCGVGQTYEENGIIIDEKFRVILSTDGGYNFIDYSEGLSALPIERLLTIDSDNDLIFCATSVGIYYRTSYMNSWECFSEGLPKVEITGLDYDYCDNVLYASTYGRGLWKTEVNLPISSTESSLVNNAETWDEPKLVRNDIRITSGGELTITNRVEILSGKKFIVEPGGTLIVDGGELTNYCGEFWEGIEVWGDFNQHQYAFNGNEYHQGRVIFKNGAIVQNAREAIRNWKPGDWSSTGGIIQADNSTFINCRRVAEFMSYQNFSPANPSLNRPDASYFYECTFQLDDDYPEDMNQFIPEARLSFWKMDRVKIEGCTFENSSETPSTSEARSIGIRAHDSNIIVREHCNDQFPEYGNCDLEIENDFIGWFRGIESLESISSRPISVSRSNFNKNMQGIYLGGSNFSRIFDNDFYLGDHPFTEFQQTESEGPETNLGISSNETFHFTIYENEFEGVNSEVLSHGVLIKNSGGNDNVVYHNNFTSLNESANGWQINRNISAVKDYIAGELGLQFNCNSNQNNLHDFRVMRTNEGNLTEFNNSGIRTNQGEPFAVYGGAGNEFTPGGNPLPNEYGHWDVDIDNNLFIRYNEYSQFNNNLLTAEMTPGTYIISNSSQNNCPSYKKDGKVSGLYEQKNTELGGLEYTTINL